MSRSQNLKAILTLIALTIPVSTYKVEFTAPDLFKRLVKSANLLENDETLPDGSLVFNVAKNPINAVAGIKPSGDDRKHFKSQDDYIFLRLIYKQDREYNKVYFHHDNLRLKSVLPFTGVVYHSGTGTEHLFESRSYTSLDDHFRAVANDPSPNILPLIGYLGEMLWALATFNAEVGYSYCMASPRGFGVDAQGKVVLIDTSAISFQKYCINSFMSIIPPEHMMSRSRYDTVEPINSSSGTNPEANFNYVLKQNDDDDFNVRYKNRTDDDAYGVFVTFHLYFRHFLKTKTQDIFQAAANNIIIGKKLLDPTLVNEIIEMLWTAVEDNSGDISGIEKLYTDFANSLEFFIASTRYVAFEQLLNKNYSGINKFAEDRKVEIEFCNNPDMYGLLDNKATVEALKKITRESREADESMLVICQRKVAVQNYCKKHASIGKKCSRLIKDSDQKHLEFILEQNICDLMGRVGFDCPADENNSDNEIEAFCEDYSEQKATVAALYDFLNDGNENRGLIKIPLPSTTAKQYRNFCRDHKTQVLLKWVNKKAKLEADKFAQEVSDLKSQYATLQARSKILAVAIQVYETTVQAFIQNEILSLFPLSDSHIDLKNTTTDYTEELKDKVNMNNTNDIRSMVVQTFVSSFMDLLVKQTKKFSFRSHIKFLNKPKMEESEANKEKKASTINTTKTQAKPKKQAAKPKNLVKRLSVEHAAVAVIGYLALLNFTQDSHMASLSAANGLKTVSQLNNFPAPCNLHNIANSIEQKLSFVALTKNRVTQAPSFTLYAFKDVSVYGTPMSESNKNELTGLTYARQALWLCRVTLFNLLKHSLFTGIEAAKPWRASEFQLIQEQSGVLSPTIQDQVNNIVKTMKKEVKDLNPQSLIPYANQVTEYLASIIKTPFLTVESETAPAKIINLASPDIRGDAVSTRSHTDFLRSSSLGGDTHNILTDTETDDNENDEDDDDDDDALNSSESMDGRTVAARERLLV